MKKILLSALTLSLGLSAFSQECEVSNFFEPGLTDVNETNTVIFEDFASEEEYANVDEDDEVTGGLFWFAADAAENPGFVGLINRDFENGNQELTITQAMGGFAPVGFGFGDSNGEEEGGDAFTRNFSDNLNFSFTATNNDPDSTIRVRIGLQDINGNVASNSVLDTDDPLSFLDSQSSNARPDLGQIELLLGPGENKTLEGTFESSVRAVFGDEDECIAAGEEGPNCIIADIDFTQISGINFTIINANNNGSPSFVQLPINEVSVTLNDVIIGYNCITGIRNNAEELETVSLYPNPSNSVVNFSEELETVTIMNTLGNVVFTGSDVNSVDVSSFEAGIYSLVSNKGSRTFIVE